MLTPIGQYVYGEEIKTETGVVTTSEISDTKQRYKVLAVGPGHFEYGEFINPSVKPGDEVIIQKHAAEGDTPPDMLGNGYALFLANRVMAVDHE